MADGGHLENQKSRYLRKYLADYDEILHDDTYRAYQLFKNRTLKNPRWRMATILKIVKCIMSATI